MLTMDELDAFAHTYYLRPDIPDHRIENRMQVDSAPRILAQLSRGSRVLELGYGDGLITAALQQAGFTAEVLEGSPILCGQARRLHPGLVVHNALFETFKPALHYDAVLALHVLEHVDDPVATLAQVAGWLVPGGVAVLVVPNRASIHRRAALRMGLIGALDDLSARDHLVGHRRVYDFATLEHDVAQAGLLAGARFGSFLKTVPNSMMLDYPDALLTAIDALSDDLPPETLANIGLVVRRPPL